jgi:hypothetical protein
MLINIGRILGRVMPIILIKKKGFKIWGIFLICHKPVGLDIGDIGDRAGGFVPDTFFF